MDSLTRAVESKHSPVYFDDEDEDDADDVTSQTLKGKSKKWLTISSGG